ncbi:MAG TPA: CehA/McbA family metallohydrolase [Candidatus Eisenbacteria bacterium]|nr:CehA/McbA family metallohydrolase [Candidatus Eisenbacteria bacterium]
MRSVGAAAGIVIAALLMAGVGRALAAAQSPGTTVQTAQLTLVVQDAEGSPLEARARLWLAYDGRPWPREPDSTLFSHSGADGFFYVNGTATLSVPQGLIQVTVGRGFEWAPFVQWVGLFEDDTLVVVLSRFTDLGLQGWYCGDMHVHSEHGPGAYHFQPPDLMWLARAEGLNVMQLLDDPSRVTGVPEPLSDSRTILYRSIEVRNQTYGHVSLPGLQAPLVDWCCEDPFPAYQMLTDLSSAAAGQGAMLVLAHPHTTDAFLMTRGWPGAGLGRELPVLAALGRLDALDVVSYSNEPDTDWSEWYDLLSSGLACAPSAGTDAVLNWFDHRPPGGWRVYANLGPGTPLGYQPWIEAVRSGRTFVTNYPLIPEFTVSGRTMGETLEVSSDTLDVEIHLQASCAIGLTSVSLVADGVTVWSTPCQGSTFDATFSLHIPTPAWIAARADGPWWHPHSPIGPAVAHTNAVRITRDGAPRRIPAASLRCLAAVDRLEDLVMARGNWAMPWHRDTVAVRMQRARDYYAQDFASAPNAFALLEPEDEASTENGFVWSSATDPDAGDSVSYRVRIAAEPTMENALVIACADTSLAELALEPEHWYWWSVEAVDRGHHVTTSTPAVRHAFLAKGASTVGVPPHEGRAPVRAFPIPSASLVRLEGFGPDVAIYDIGGRRIAELGRGIEREGTRFVWDGTALGRTASPGVYLARGDGNRRARVVRLK